LGGFSGLCWIVIRDADVEGLARTHGVIEKMST
jgi:hypothetical protein